MTELSDLDEHILKGMKNFLGDLLAFPSGGSVIAQSQPKLWCQNKKKLSELSANSAFSNAFSLSAAVCSNNAKVHAGRNKTEIGLNIWTKSQKKTKIIQQLTSALIIITKSF